MLVIGRDTTPFRALAAAICCLLAGQSTPLRAQEVTEPKLNIVIVEGEGAINNIRQRTAREPIVQVEDENRRPVAGAVVVFLLPDRNLTVTTDSQGRAAARGLRPNNASGQYQIRVTASFQGRTASTMITQTNIAAAAGAAAGGISAKLIAILAVAGGAAVAGGVVAATRGNGNGAAAPIVVTPGTPSVGGPR
jgi:hypothetical protein